MNEKNMNKEAEKHNQTQLNPPGRNVGGDQKYRQSSAKICKNAALKVSAQN